MLKQKFLMVRGLRYRRTSAIIFLIVASIFALTRCINKEQEKEAATKTTSFEQFAGSEKCVSCHKDVYEKHTLTAHFLTSSISSAENVKGNFTKNKNTFVFNDHVKMVMQKRDSSFYQVEYLDNNERKARRFDITTGSGTKGQTYMYWWGDTLFQLPLTYFTPLDEWTNSPGYPNKVAFGRPVTARCMECHSSFAQIKSPPSASVDEFDRNKIIYGVDCEKCHGPAAEHINFQSQNPEIKEARYIINPSSFTRQQSLDLCRLCHGGRLNKTQPSFSFQPGDKLEDFFGVGANNNNPADIDVHGNQFGLLSQSKCFTNSQMTCVTCHNVHENEKNKLTVFSQRCITCHNESHEKECKLKKTEGLVIMQNCIDCHMPEKPSNAIVVLRQGQNMSTAAVMRTHYIKAYPEETNKVLEHFKNLKK